MARFFYPVILLCLLSPGFAAPKENAAFYREHFADYAAKLRAGNLPLREKISRYAFFVVETHRQHGIGYLWGGDMLDHDPDPSSEGGVGYDCSGFVQSVYEAILPDSSFNDAVFRINASHYLDLGREILPMFTIEADQRAKALTPTSYRLSEGFSPSSKQLAEVAEPGDILVNKTHMCLVGTHPDTRETIILENGYEWLPLVEWLKANRGKPFSLRSAFDAQATLLTATHRPFTGKVKSVRTIETGSGPCLIPILPEYVKFDLRKSAGWSTRRNRDLYHLYLSGITSQLRGNQALTVEQRVALTALLFTTTLREAGIGACDYGDILEAHPFYRSGVGFDDIGFVWSAWLAATQGEPFKAERWTPEYLKKHAIAPTSAGRGGGLYILRNGEIWLRAESMYFRSGTEMMDDQRWLRDKQPQLECIVPLASLK